MKSNLKIYLDGPSEQEMKELNDDNVKGYTFNPSLFKALGVTDYLAHSKKVLEMSNGLPASLEVIGDNYDELISQSKKLNSLGDNVYVKIPISFTNGESTLDVISDLVNEGIKLNITAIFTLDQIKKLFPVLNDSSAIISVFAGRLYDIGINAAPLLKEMANLIHSESNCSLFWASTRMHYDYITATESNCDIITMNASMYKKMSLFDKEPLEYSLETVKMFYADAIESKYKI